MASTINGTSTGNGGLISTGDDSGILNIQTNETTAITVDASQRVGIGTSSPTQPLQINMTTGDQGIKLQAHNTTAGNRLSFADSSGTEYGLVNYDHGSDFMSFYTNSSERVRIDSSGNLKLTNSNNIASITQTAISLTGGTAGSPFVNGQSVNVITANSTTRGILIVGSTQNCSAIFFINASQPVNLSSQTTNETRFSITSGSSNTANVFVSGSNIVLQNNIQASRDFYVTYIGQI